MYIYITHTFFISKAERYSISGSKVQTITVWEGLVKVRDDDWRTCVQRARTWGESIIWERIAGTHGGRSRNRKPESYWVSWDAAGM